MELAAGADLLIHDAQHLAAQFPGVGFLGHASVEYCVALAREAGVRTVALSTTRPRGPTTRSTRFELMAASGRRRGRVVAAHEGLALDLPDPGPPPEEAPVCSSARAVTTPARTARSSA